MSVGTVFANNSVEPSHIKPYGDYPQAIRNLAKSKKIALVDMTTLTAALYQRLGKDSTTKLFVFHDNTHIIEAGAIQVAKLFVDDIVSQGLKPISYWVKGVTSIKQVSLHSAVKQSGRIVCQGKGVFNLVTDDKLQNFSVFSLDGKVINTKGKLPGDNTLLLTSTSGQILSSGKYLIKYTPNTGVKRTVSVDIN